MVRQYYTYFKFEFCIYLFMYLFNDLFICLACFQRKETSGLKTASLPEDVVYEMTTYAKFRNGDEMSSSPWT